MPESDRKPSAMLRKGRPPHACSTAAGPDVTHRLIHNALCASLACLLPVLAATPCAAAETTRPGVGEAYIFNQHVEPKTGSAPGKVLELSLRTGVQGAAEFLDPSSRAWAGAQGLSLKLERAAVLLTSDVIASTGDGRMAAASHADGRIRLFGAGNCTSIGMPGGPPAYALALASEGDTLAAWAQGVNRLVFFDLNAPGCAASSTDTALRGQISLSLSSSGAFVAAQDEGGRIWVGSRGGEMRLVASLNGAPAAIGFTGGEGVLLVLDAQGRGGSWSPRTGKALRTLEVPGGPFTRGEFQGFEARLWTMDGRLVRWDMLHNRSAEMEGGPAEAEKRPSGPATAQSDGWLELRGADLYYARPGHSWRPQPVYEPHLPQLSHSRHAACLRLSDVDGVVRYYNARTGLSRAQCFADDWAAVAIKSDGTAQIPGLQLRIYSTLSVPGGGSKVNSRALSDKHVLLWTESAPDLTLRVEAPPAVAQSIMLEIVGNTAKTAIRSVSVPLREGLAADAPAWPLLLQ
jgi:hypothetical protein